MRLVVWLGGWLAVSLVVQAAPVSAQESFGLMSMPASYTDVIDAFDGADVLDVNVRVGFLRSSRSGTIQRERTVDDGSGMGARRLVNVAEHSHVTNSLRLGLDVGLYKDLAVYGALPLVLRDSRQLSLPSGRDAAAVAGDLFDPARDAAGNLDPLDQQGALFDVPFKSPARSGIPAVHLGIAWAPMNQFRTADLPTWVLMLETRVATSSVVRACSAQDTSCRSPGVSDGTSALRLESRTSYRFRYVEPYIGLAAELPWVSTGEQLYRSDLPGLVRRQPPRTAEFTAGASFIPWEDRERFQRVALDVRFTGAYATAGRQVTPLFDALGSSANPFLAAPNYDRVLGVGETSPPVSMTGVTETSPNVRIGVRTGVVIQAAKYIRFTAGVGLAYTTPHWLTGTDACNPSVASGMSDPRRGQCTAGILNPAHRPVIDAAGNRFRLDGEMMFDVYSSATAQF